MNTFTRILILILVSTCFLASCSSISNSIQSDSVRYLINKEGEMISKAKTDADSFIKANKMQIDALGKMVNALDMSRKDLQIIEAKHSLVFSSNKNISTQKGVDAQASAYLIGKIYLADQSGLDKKVKDQFEEDFMALEQTAKKLKESWESLEKLQSQINEYAQKSSFASADRELIKAIAGEFPQKLDHIDEVLEKSKKVNESLEKAMSYGVFGEKESGNGQTAIKDVIEILEYIKQ